MTIKIAIPTPLRSYTDHNKSVELEADTVSAALLDLVDQYPRLEKHLYEDSQLRNFVNIYLNDEDVRYLDLKLESPLHPGDVIAIIPSIAGGLL